jgi:hypothetical protein
VAWTIESSASGLAFGEPQVVRLPRHRLGGVEKHRQAEPALLPDRDQPDLALDLVADDGQFAHEPAADILDLQPRGALPKIDDRLGLGRAE